jgi:hypothetical protein
VAPSVRKWVTTLRPMPLVPPVEKNEWSAMACVIGVYRTIPVMRTTLFSRPRCMVDGLADTSRGLSWVGFFTLANLGDWKPEKKSLDTYRTEHALLMPSFGWSSKYLLVSIAVE